jgi:hypothetical protein
LKNLLHPKIHGGKEMALTAAVQTPPPITHKVGQLAGNWNGGAWNFTTIWEWKVATTNLPVLRGFSGAQNPSVTP